MKRITFFLSFVSLAMISCSLETSDNGDFDGYWHLLSVDTLATSGHTDISEKTVFWAVQLHLIQLRGANSDGEGRECYVRFDRQQEFLTISDPHVKERSVGDPIITEDLMYLLSPYGINEMTEQFQVVELTEDRMILKSALLLLSFRKQ